MQETNEISPKTVSLVLGSGGARGMAHIGIIQWLQENNYAIRASFAIPTVFTPYDYLGRKLLDGGLLNPVPIAPTLNDLTDLTIAVDLNARPEPQPDVAVEEPAPKEPENHHKKRIRKFIEDLSPRKREKEHDWGFVEVIHHSIETMQNTISRFKLAAYSPDVIIDIPKNACGMFEFYRAKELTDLGRRKAEAALAGL